MAEVFLFSIAELLIAKTASRAYVEGSKFLSVDIRMRRFRGTLLFVKVVLLDAEQGQVENPLLKEWLLQVGEVFSDAENVLDEFDYETLRRQVVKAHGTIKTKVGSFFSSSNPLLFRLRMVLRMEKINRAFCRVAYNRYMFDIQEKNVDRRVVHRREMTHSYVDSYVIGREHDKENIVQLLIQHDNDKSLSVIPIVGMGGLGKTTLAKYVFNDKRIDECFPLKIWVCDSDQEFNIKKMIIKIINSSYADAPASEILDMEQLQIQLRNKLAGEKFLLVLDDMWTEDRIKWDQLRYLLQVGAEGSKTLVTTRNLTVASIMGTGPHHELGGLSPEASWSLFVKWAFKEGEEKNYPHLVTIGREIVEKCRGIPLAVRTLGSMLFSNYETGEWEYVRDNKIWNLPQRDGILPALELSYNRMPSYLKQCFSLFSLYPRDYAFDSFGVTLLWAALGLLPSPKSNQTLKRGANQHLHEMLSISFLQDFVDYGIGFAFKIHDLVHDLAISVARRDCHLAYYPFDAVGRNVKHLSFSENEGMDKFPVQRLAGVRTILFPTAGVGANSKAFLNACMSRYKHLRFFDLSDSTYETLPRSIGKLKHLRYLSLENNRKIKALPDSICNLLMLEMLILSGCTELERLPNGLKKLISLQHLEITTKQFVLPEDEIANLSSLQTLRIDFCNNLESLFGGTIKLFALRVLCVANCRSLKSLPLDIEHFPALETLLVDNCDMLEMSEGHEDQNSNLRLKVLTIVSLPKLVTLPHWLQRSVYTLQHLSISSCINLAVLPEWLPAMICLKTLCITGCPNMLSLPNGIHRLATLERFEIDGYPELFSNSQPHIGESLHAHNTIDELEDEEEIEELE